MHIAVKVLLSIPIGIGLLYPLLNPQAAGGILAELKIFGQGGAIVAFAVFFLLVVLYARSLKITLQRVAPAARKARPDSVWYMLLLPYNFIEDFFIIANIARSIQAEAAINPALRPLRSFGMASGMLWCCAQIVSLIPTALGSIAGVIAIAGWLWHWVFICRVNRLLKHAAA